MTRPAVLCNCPAVLHTACALQPMAAQTIIQQTSKTLPHLQMLLKEQIKMLTYGKTFEPCPSFVFLLLIRHLSNPWWHPSLLRNANKMHEDNVDLWRKCSITCKISVTCNQNHKEHFHCRKDSSRFWITSETPQCSSTGTQLEKHPKYHVSFKSGI